MTLALSPAARRILALALAAFAGLLALTLLQALVSLTGDALSSLEQARARAVRVEAMRERPTPPEPTPIPASLYIQAPGHRAAAVVAVRQIQAAAATVGLGVGNFALADQESGNPNFVRIGFLIEGPEARVLGFIGDLERGLPAIRLREWRVERVEGPTPTLRLRAVAVAAWEGPQ